MTFTAPTVPPATSLYQRTIQIQQFSSGDVIEDGSLDDPRDGATDKDEIQLKLVRVSVRPLWGGTGTGSGIFEIFGKRTPIAIEVLKAV